MNNTVQYVVDDDTILWDMVISYLQSDDFILSTGDMNINMSTNLASIKDECDFTKLEVNDYNLSIRSECDIEAMFLFTDIVGIRLKKVKLDSLEPWKMLGNDRWIMTVMDIDHRICDIHLHDITFSNGMRVDDDSIVTLFHLLNRHY